MQLKTVLNRVHPVKGFVYGTVRFSDLGIGDVLEVKLRPRTGSRAWCSGCGRRGPTYDHLPERLFAFVPLWAIPVYLWYAMRRVDCPQCGVTVEMVPWAIGKRPLTRAYAVFLARWARRLSWREVAEVFQTSWESVYRSVKWVVDYGLQRRDLSGITAIGIDEVQFRKGHRYLTLVYQIDSGCRRLLWIGKDRTEKICVPTPCPRITVCCLDCSRQQQHRKMPIEHVLNRVFCAAELVFADRSSCLPTLLGRRVAKGLGGPEWAE